MIILLAVACRMLVLVCHDCQKETIQYVCELCLKYGKVSESIPTVNDDNLGVRLTRDTGILHTGHPCLNPAALKKLRILGLHGFRQNASSFKGRTASLAKKLKSLADLVFVNAPHELPFIYLPGKILNDDRPPTGNCSKKYAWLVSPDFPRKKTNDWETIATPLDPLQYQQQTKGFEKSLSFLKSVFTKEGPFDGILGFSQGAAMTALLCDQRRKYDLGLDFRFAIFCSGFAINLEGCGEGSLKCASLHVFGTRGVDRQISSNYSRDLTSYFEDGCRTIIEHNSGHIIPY